MTSPPSLHLSKFLDIVQIMKCGGVCVCLEVQNLSYISHNDQDWKGITLLYMQLWKAVTQSRHILEKQLQRAKKSQV